MADVVCGVNPASFKGRCEPGVNMNTELCSYNVSTKRCNKASKKTWAQIEADLKKGVVPKEAEHIQVPLEAVEQVIAEGEIQCGIQTSPFVRKCQKGLSSNGKYCKYNASTKNCIKGTTKTWETLEKELGAGVVVPAPAEEAPVAVPAEAPIKDVCGIQTKPFSRKCAKGVGAFSKYCKMTDKGSCVKATTKTWDTLEKELAGLEEAEVVEPAPALCGFDLAKKNCVRGKGDNQEYCQPGLKGQCKKADKYDKYSLDEIARMVQGEEVAEKVAKPDMCGIDPSNVAKGCQRGITTHQELCEPGLKGQCRKNAKYAKYTLKELEKLVQGEELAEKEAKPDICGFDLAKKNCVRGKGDNQEYCQPGLKGQCKKADKYDKYSLDEIARMVQGEEVAVKVPVAKVCGIKSGEVKRGCQLGVGENNEYCEYSDATKKCRRTPQYQTISLDEIEKRIKGEPAPSAKYCKLSTGKRTCEDALESENDEKNCYYNTKTKKCTKYKVPK